MKIKLTKDWYTTLKGSIIVIQKIARHGVLTYVEGKELYDDWEIQKFKMMGDSERDESENVDEAYRRVCDELLKYGTKI